MMPSETLALEALGFIGAALLLVSVLLGFQTKTLKPPLGCTKRGLVGKSQLSDQYDPKYSSNSDVSSVPLDQQVGTVKALHIFPIKSCRGVEVRKVKITKTGPEHDRQFAFAQYHQYTEGDEKVTGWNKLTQREFPRMVLVEPEVWEPDPSTSTFSKDSDDVKNGGCLVVSFPRRHSFSPLGLINFLFRAASNAFMRVGMEPALHTFRLPLEPSPPRMKELELPKVKVKVWADTAHGIDLRPLVPPEVLQELKDFLGVSNPFAIFRTDPEHYREVHRNAPQKDNLGYQAVTGFADSYPLHLLNLASVRNVASYIPSVRLDARRFRSNVLITGPPAHSEDNWKRASIGPSAFQFHLTDRTTRCQLPNVDPANGTVAPYKLPYYREPLRTLLRRQRSRNPAFMEPLKAMRDPQRANRCIDEGAEGKACLGMQAVPRMAGDGEEVWISVGDAVVVLETGEHYFKAS